jgi:hypothetical protein
MSLKNNAGNERKQSINRGRNIRVSPMKDKTLRQEVEDLRSEVQQLKALVNQMAYALFEGEEYEEEGASTLPPKPTIDDTFGMMFN